MSILSQQKQSVNTDFPNLRPSLDLRFALAKKLDPRITFTRGSSGTYFGPDGLMRTAGVNEPRFDHDPVTGQSLGLLVEEQRTNLVRNNTAQGAVVGTPGTLPTNSYAFIAPSGITREITSIGTENGITYFDIRYYGVSASSGEISWAPQTATNTPITGGQVVSASVYLKAVSGTFANISSLSVRVLDYTGSTYLTESSTVFTTSSLQSSTLQRYNHTRTTSASANGVVFSITLNKTSAGPVDITLRIGMPQVELGPEPTSVIATTSSTVTRSTDNADMTGTNFSSWYNQTEGTFFTDVKSSAGFISGINACPFGIFGAANNIVLANYHSLSSIWFFRNSVGTNNAFFNVSMSTTQNRKSIATYRTGTADYYTAAFGGSNLRNSTTNLTSATPKTGTLRTDQISFELNPNKSGLVPLNGTISRLTYYPIQVTNQQLINLTN